MAADHVRSFLAEARTVADHHRKAARAVRAKKIIPLRHLLYTKERLERMPSRGDKLLAELRAALRYFDQCNEHERSVHQKSFHESMLGACIRNLYDDTEFTDNYHRILEKNGWSEARQEIVRFRVCVVANVLSASG